MSNNFFKIIITVLLWQLPLGLFAQGYVKLSQLNTENGLKQNSITEIIQDNDGYLLIGTSEGINRFDGYRINNLFESKNTLESKFIETIWQDSKDLIWISAYPENNYILNKKDEILNLL